MVLFIKVLIPKPDPSRKFSMEIVVQFMDPSEDREPKSIFVLLRSCNALVDCRCSLILHLFQLSKPPTQTALIAPTSVCWVIPLPILEMSRLPTMTHTAHTHAGDESGILETKTAKIKTLSYAFFLPVFLVGLLLPWLTNTAVEHHL